ncbi:MAG: acetyl-CoA carboxylase biotin carboxyl carrier protein [Candidatus Gastranaerophilales bacterium]|nr:acetyl-CoA carboxylase biotin carboxyl carrier protein [Candidatus Gastranaerophilales bacterium]
MKFELDYLEKLAELVNKNNLSEITLEDGDRAIVLRREKEIVASSGFIAPAAVAVSAPKEETKLVEKAPEAKKGTPVTSPMVGTFYAAPSPDDEPFVKLGKIVAKDDTVCIIEAMKLMNEIKTEFSGKVVEICVENGQPVEFGQVLMYIE